MPFQLEFQGEKMVQNLLVKVDLATEGSTKLIVQKGKPSSRVTQTYGRYVPERKDVWVKSTSRMVINERYKRGKYHDNLGDGMDYYQVGYTCGAGNSYPYVKDSIYYSKNYVGSAE